MAQLTAIELGYVYDVDEKRVQDIPAACQNCPTVRPLHPTGPDLVVEAAHADLLKEVAVRIVERSDLLLFSITALADRWLSRGVGTNGSQVRAGRSFCLMEP